MWAIRILTGPQTGQVFPLRAGRNLIGRGPTCAVKVNSHALSREHASVYITDDKVILTDLNSRNGTYLNGVRVQNQKMRLGDKILLHDTFADLIQIPDQAVIGGSQGPLMPSASGAVVPPPPAWAGNLAMRQSPQMHTHQHDFAHAHADLHALSQDPHLSAPATGQGRLFVLGESIRNYIDSVAMPGVYSLVQSMSYFQGIALLLLVYALVVTSLSIIPMMTATKEAIQSESLRRARTIARNLATLNTIPVRQRDELAYDLRSAEREEGVAKAFLVSGRDGTILSPAAERGSISRDGFVREALRQNRDHEEIRDPYIKVSIPIMVYRTESGSQQAEAYAVVFYDMSTIALNQVSGLVLFFKTLAIAILLGGILFYILMRVIEHPVRLLGRDFDDALRDPRGDIASPYNLPILQTLIINLNTALQRIESGGSSSGDIGANVVAFNRDTEAANMVQIFLGPSIAIDATDQRIIFANTLFEQLANLGQPLANKSTNSISDSSLAAKLDEMMAQMKVQLDSIHRDTMSFPSGTFEISGQTIMGTTEPAWFFFALTKKENAY
jgi:pSer/pThr/pTyr-binding forkhead associated (FHA) protein